MSLLKKGFHVIPDVMFGSVKALLGLCMVGIGLAKYYAMDGDNRRYKSDIVIMRSDDPRANKVHRD